MCETVINRHLFIFAVLREVVSMKLWLTMSHNPSDSDSWVMGLKACTTNLVWNGLLNGLKGYDDDFGLLSTHTDTLRESCAVVIWKIVTDTAFLMHSSTPIPPKNNTHTSKRQNHWILLLIKGELVVFLREPPQEPLGFRKSTGLTLSGTWAVGKTLHPNKKPEAHSWRLVFTWYTTGFLIERQGRCKPAFHSLLWWWFFISDARTPGSRIRWEKEAMSHGTSHRSAWREGRVHVDMYLWGIWGAIYVAMLGGKKKNKGLVKAKSGFSVVLDGIISGKSLYFQNLSHWGLMRTQFVLCYLVENWLARILACLFVCWLVWIFQ